MSAGSSGSRAFTLIEVLVASAMVAVLVAAMYTTLYTAFKARRSTTQKLDDDRSLRLAVETMGRDIQAALPPVGLFAGAFIGQDQQGAGGHDADTLTFYSTRPAAQSVIPEVNPGSSPDSDGEASSRNENGGENGDVQQVTLALVSPSELTSTGDEAGGAPTEVSVLVRRVSSDPLAPVATTPNEQVLCRGVLSFNLRYFDGVQWLDAWDSTTRDNELPHAVELTMETAITSATGDAAKTGNRLVRIFVPFCGAPATSDDADATGETSTP